MRPFFWAYSKFSPEYRLFLWKIDMCLKSLILKEFFVHVVGEVTSRIAP